MIGLAVLASKLASVGNTVEVSVDGVSVPAMVDVLPIYDTNKERPRS